MRHLDLFSGIGGFALAADWVWGKDHEIVAFVEIDEFCQKVLKRHWPGVRIHGDIRTFAYTQEWWEQEQSLGDSGYERKRKAQVGSVAGASLGGVVRGVAEGTGNGGRVATTIPSVDLLTGGTPCQPASVAGKRRGTTDDRWLWEEALRIVRETSPRWVVLENPTGILSLERGLPFDKVLSDLEVEGYETQTVVLPACAVNAPHRRDRVWIVAHSKSWRERWCKSDGSRRWESEVPAGDSNRHAPDTGHTLRPQYGDTPRVGREREQTPWDEDWYSVALRTCVRPLDDGLPGGLVRPKGWRVNALKAAGNAIVPSVVAEIFKAIKAIEEN